MKRKNQISKIGQRTSSLVLLALVLVAVIIFNVIIAMLAQRYEWMYKDMNIPAAYVLSEDYEEYVNNSHRFLPSFIKL